MQKIRKHKIILGGGIAGLIKAYFNRDAMIISDKIGGQFSTSFQLGPKFLHVDEYSKRFIEELNMTPLIKQIKIGFWYDGCLHMTNNENNRKNYFDKTRSQDSKIYSSSMSANMTEFKSFDIDVAEIINVLKNKLTNEIILEKIKNIDLENKKIITENTEIQYDELISTIPLNIFLFLSDKIDLAKRFKSHPTTFILNSSVNSCPFCDFENYDYVYISEKRYIFHRITKTDKGPVFECKGDNIPKMIGEIDRITLKVGQLIQNDIDINIKNVEFFGRYSKWQHNLLTNTLLKHEYDRIKS